MKKILYSLCAVAALLFTSCDDPAEGTTFVADGQSPISNRLLEMGGFSEYVGILQKSNMFNALNYKGNSKGFTALAPTDAAMAEFYTRSGVTLETMTPEFARDFVLYHTLEDSLSFEKVMPEVGKDSRSLKNLSNDKITVTVCDNEEEGLLRLTNSNSYGIVTETDSAKNGSIFILSRALTPLVENLYDRVLQDEEYGIMRQALEETGWDETLTTLVDPVTGESRSYTILGVTDATFAKAEIGSLEALKEKLVELNTEEGITADSLLRAYVGYHIVVGSNTVSSLGAVQGSNTTRLWDCGAKNLVFTITTDEEAETMYDRYVINKESETPVHFVAEKSNVLALNGYLHQIDSWMPMWEPEQQTVVWDLAENPTIKEIAGDDYQPEEVTGVHRYDVSTAFGPDAIVAKENKNGNFFDGVTYYVPTININAAGIKAGVRYPYNNDCLVFNLGNTGSASLPTPTLVRGKYKVVLSLIYVNDHADIKKKTKGSGGTIEMSFDGKDKKYDAPYTKIPTYKPLQHNGAYDVEIYDVVEFESTSSHTFTFTVKDGAAATESKYSLMFDTITFIPVE